MNEWEHEKIEGRKSSQLRQSFESLEGKFQLREIDTEKVGSNVYKLEERPSYHPYILINQLKRKNELGYFFNERIFASNEFLDKFERVYIRRCEEAIEAENFEDLPENYKDYFDFSSHAKVPVEFDMMTGQGGVDFNDSCTLKVLDPEQVNSKLADIEEKATFLSSIHKVSFSDEEELWQELLGSEGRIGNENMTFIHYVFRKSY